MNPSGTVWREAARGNDTMHVRVSEEILAPGMKLTEEANACSQMLGMSGHFQ